MDLKLETEDRAVRMPLMCVKEATSHFPLREMASARWFPLVNRRFRVQFVQFTKFCIVGGSGVVIDMGILYLLADPSRLALNITLSKICAADVAMINNFIWNEIWTFRIRYPHRGEGGCKPVQVETHLTKTNARNSLLCRFVLFSAICGIGIGLAVPLLHLFHAWLGLNLYLANLLAIVLVTAWNYCANALFTWCARPEIRK